MMIAGMFGLLFFGTLYLQRVLGYSSLQAGLGYVPIAVVIAAISLGLSARLDHPLRPASDAVRRARAR